MTDAETTGPAATMFDAWIAAYVRAWESNDPGDIARLFTEDAAYSTAPFRQPWQGRDTILAEWLKIKDEPGTWTFTWELLGISDDLGFVRGWTTYTDQEHPISNLWIVHLAPDGRCAEFTEWWMEEK